MENLNDVEQRSLVDILTQGEELSTQLKNQMNPLASKETYEHLIQKILSTYDQAMACLNLTELLKSDPSPISSLVEPSNGVSPKIGYARGHSHRDVFKKRKTLPERSEEIKVCSGTGLEGPLDGHSWRKYGQKNILGATQPRAYYRCTHKYTRGCRATKQVQKTEQDPSIFVITYRGKHTCMDVLNSSSPVVSMEEKSKDIINNLHQITEPKQVQNIPFKFEQCLKVENEEINTKVVGHVSSFFFPSTSIQSENQDIWEQFEDNNILAGLISPATCETNNFYGSTCQVLPYPYSIRSDISDMISTPTAGMNSLFNLDMDTVEPKLSFDVLDYFTTSV